METKVVIQTIVTLLSEAYAGPADATSTWFIDNEPDSGILGIIAGVSAVEASWSANNDNPGTTIASHVEHLRWSLANANGALMGKPYLPNWKESWNTVTADESKWKNLQDELRKEFEMLRKNIETQKDLPGEYMPGVMALISHAAYHLGTIRQLIERARESVKNLY
jgi:hypothetical protein